MRATKAERVEIWNSAIRRAALVAKTLWPLGVPGAKRQAEATEEEILKLLKPIPEKRKP